MNNKEISDLLRELADKIENIDDDGIDKYQRYSMIKSIYDAIWIAHRLSEIAPLAAALCRFKRALKRELGLK